MVWTSKTPAGVRVSCRGPTPQVHSDMFRSQAFCAERRVSLMTVKRTDFPGLRGQISAALGEGIRRPSPWSIRQLDGGVTKLR